MFRSLAFPAALLAFLLAALLAFLLPAAASAAPLPRPADVALPAELPLLPKIEAALRLDRGEDGSPIYKALEPVLAQLPAPTRLRGLVQFLRGIHASDRAAARAAIEESVRLLPEHTMPLLVAAQMDVFAGRPGEAADALLRASRIDRRSLELVADYEMGSVLGRLSEARDTVRLHALSERLVEVDWSRGTSARRAWVALNAVEARIARGDTAGAASLVPRLRKPRDFARLLTEKKFAALRPAVESWAGARLEKQWPIYLDEARREWERTRDLAAGQDYLVALREAGHLRTIVATFGPFYEGEIDRQQFQLTQMASTVAAAYAELGQWDRALRVFERGLATWPADEEANGLNFIGNRARLRIMKGDFEAGLADADRMLEASKRFGGEVNSGAIAAVHLYRACALHQLGRTTGDDESTRLIGARRNADPTSAIWLDLCRGDTGFAKATLLAAFENEASRGEALGWVQPAPPAGLSSDFARLMHGRGAALQKDPAVRRAAAKYGRILGEPVAATAPKEAPVPAR